MQLSLLNNPKDAELVADAEFMAASLYAVLDNHADEIVVNALKILANAQDSSKIITELLPSLSDEQTENLITAVGIFAQILNIAEDVHHERRRLVHEQKGSAAQEGSMAETVRKLQSGAGGAGCGARCVEPHAGEPCFNRTSHRSATPSGAGVASQDS